MYDKKLKKWISDCNTDELRQKCLNPANANDKEVQFLKSSDLLSKIKTKQVAAEAVAGMDKLAKENYPPALYGMGQMFYYGWGVHTDRKKAVELYKKAADKGYEPAKQILAEMKKAKKAKIISAVVSVLAVAGIAAALIFFWPEKAPPVPPASGIIKVNEKTSLSKVEAGSEFANEMSDIILEYDDEEVISGNKSTNRLIVKYDGTSLDLSEFEADLVIANSKNTLIIQFSDKEKADDCYNKLQNAPGVIFVERDEYNVSSNYISEEYCTLEPVESTEPGSDYYSWGVPDMGLDQLSDYVSEYYGDKELVVGVIDFGALVHSENSHRYIEGYNVVTGGKVVPARHGTHVVGTVLDGADCDNIKVWNLDVFNGHEGTSSLLCYSAIELCIENNVDVINMSLGGPCERMLHEGIKEAYDAGIPVVVAAGNETADIADGLACPADIPQAITVGAYDINHEIADFSNYGAAVDVCAPGVKICSYSHEKDGKLVFLQGTSMASPHIAAMAALLRAIYPDITPTDIKNYIKNSCRTFTNEAAYATNNYGAGAPDATIFIEEK